MTKLPIVTGQHQPILRTVVKPVVAVNKKTLELIRDMKETMLKANGVGIAAPQVNVDARIIICRFQASTKNERIVAMINPKITSFSEDTVLDEEGCLSLPGVFGKVMRPRNIQVEYLDEKGRLQNVDFQEFDARIIQHEVDHLNGVLFIDYVKGKN